MCTLSQIRNFLQSKQADGHERYTNRTLLNQCFPEFTVRMGTFLDSDFRSEAYGGVNLKWKRKAPALPPGLVKKGWNSGD
jgi:hypothetical protein